MTKNSLIDDIELRIYKGKPSDDSELDKSQIAFWIDSEREEIILDDINSTIKKGGEVNPIYIKKDTCLPITKEVLACDTATTNSRFSIQLTSNVLNVIKGKGIIRITNSEGDSLIGTSELMSEVLSELPFGGTSTGLQSFYLEGDKVFIQRSTNITLQFLSYNVYYIPAGVGFNTSGDEEYPIEEALVPVLLERVEEVARREMSLGVSDLDNDGKDPYHV